MYSISISGGQLLSWIYDACLNSSFRIWTAFACVHACMCVSALYSSAQDYHYLVTQLPLQMQHLPVFLLENRSRGGGIVARRGKGGEA